MFKLRFTLVVLAVILCQHVSAQSETHRLDAPLVDYPVQAVEYSGGYTLIRGYFNQAGDYSGSIIPVDPLNGIDDGTWPVISGEVNALVSDGSGGYFAGGYIRAVDNEDVGNLIHIRADKTLDRNWLPNPLGTVTALALEDGVLYVGGTFATINGQSRQYAAAFDIATGELTSWNPHANNRITEIEVAENAVFLAGPFTQLNNGITFRNQIASVNKTDGAVIAGWNLTLDGNGWSVNALASSTSTLYVGGSFTSANGEARNGLVAVSKANADVASFDPSPMSTGNAVIHSLVLDNTTLYIAGSFDEGLAGDNTIRHLGAVNTSTGALITSFRPAFDINDQIFSIELFGGTIFASGTFNSVNSITRVQLAAVRTSDGSTTNWNPKVQGSPITISSTGGSILIGGEISGLNWEVYNGMAIIGEGTGKFWPHQITLGSGEDIHTMVVNDQTMYVGGRFNSINGMPRKNLAAIDLRDGSVLPWNPGASGTTTTAFDDTQVTALKFRDNTVYVAGIFLNSGGQPRRGLAAIDATTAIATAWNPGVGDAIGMDEYILSMDMNENALILGGTFQTLAGQARHYLGAVNLSDGTLLTWRPQVSSEVRKVRIKGNSAYILGDFSKGVGNAIRNFGIAAVDVTTGEATSFDPQFNSSDIADFAITETDIYIGGYYSTAEGEIRPGLASFSITTGQLNSWNPDLGSASEGIYSVAALATSATRLYVGGGFVSVGNENRVGYAEYQLSECTAVTPITLDGSTLYAAPADTYQWYVNDIPVAGAISQSYEINVFEYGRFSVEVTVNGCTARSSEYIYLVTGHDRESEQRTACYPNPVIDDLYIKVFSESVMTVLDLAGRPVSTNLLQRDQNRISTDHLTPGTYIVRIDGPKSTETFKIVKTK